MRSVYAYANLGTLCEEPYFDDLSKLPIITSSISLSQAVRSAAGRHHPIRSTSFSRLFRQVCGCWKSKGDRIDKMAMSARFFRERISESTDEEEIRTLRSYNRNRSSLVFAIEVMVEADMYPADLVYESMDARILRELWEYLEKNCSGIRVFRESMDETKVQGFLESKLDMILGEGSYDTIVLQGFYFITPLQERFFQSLENLGYRLVMLVQYNPVYPYVHEVWRDTLCNPSRYAPYTDWIMPASHIVNPMAEILEGYDSTSDIGACMKRYPSMFEFVNDVREQVEAGYQLFSPDVKTAENILSDIFSDTHGRHGIASFPIGEFIIALHRMWDDESGDMIIDYDSVVQCFTTGWLSTDENDSRDYTSDIMSLCTMFSDCRTIADWRGRIDHLRSVYDSVISVFSSRDGESLDRWDNLMSNPFHNLGAFSIEHRRLDTILGFIEELLEMISDIAGQEDRFHFREYLEKIYSSLVSHARDDGMIQEVGLLKGLIDDLPEDQGDTYLPSELSSTLIAYLNGELQDSEDTDNRSMLIHNMGEVEAASVSDGTGVSMVLCDISRMPGRNHGLAWPLSDEMLDSTKRYLDDRHRDYLEMLEHVANSAYKSNRYLFSMAFDCRNLIVSWIENMDGKVLQPSPYMRLLDKNCGKSIEESGRVVIGGNLVHSTEPGCRPIQVYDIKDRGYRPNEARMDFSVCSWRYVYGYILEDHPHYDEWFHVQAVLSNMVSVFSDMVPEFTRSSVCKQLLDLFPGITRSERRQILDNVPAIDSIPDFEYEGRVYCGNLLMASFPQKNIREVARREFGNLYTPVGRKAIDLNRPSEFKGLCTYCQHGTYCRNRVHPFEQEEFYGDE